MVRSYLRTTKGKGFSVRRYERTTGKIVHPILWARLRHEFDTVVGKFRFNEKGDPNLPPYAVYRWSNGNCEEIGDEAPAPAG